MEDRSNRSNRSHGSYGSYGNHGNYGNYGNYGLLWSLLLAASCLLAACSDDSVIDSEAAEGREVKALTFNMHKRNMTRADAADVNTTQHYEFGVFAYRPSIDLTDDETSSVFRNDLVAYAKADPEGNAYKNYANIDYASTWGDGSTRSSSYWVYESLGNAETVKPSGITTASGQYTKSEWGKQYLRYWDYSHNYTYFWAYTPYMRSTNSGVSLGDGERYMTFGGSGTTGELTFSSVSSFYINPVDGKQISTLHGTGIMESTGYNSSADITTEDELINANEVMYAATPMAVGNYDNDVDLTFKHANAKIQITLYHELEGWDVELIDMIPESAATAINGEIGTGKTFEGYPTQSKVEGIVLTPATKDYAGAYLQKPKTDADYSALYYDRAKMQIGNIVNTTVSNTESFLVGGGTEDSRTKNNLYFKIPAAGKNLPTSKTDAVKSENILPTTYYALPNTQGSARIDKGDTNYSDGLSINTGFTIHVSYKMKAKDSGEELPVYDARVFVPADEFTWIGGRSYIYVFRVTKNSNGVLNPKKPDPTDPDTPYLDEDDPRVVSDPAMSPIVFDGVVVEDYESTTSTNKELE